MKNCVLLTMDNPAGFEIYDSYLHAPLKKRVGIIIQYHGAVKTVIGMISMW